MLNGCVTMRFTTRNAVSRSRVFWAPATPISSGTMVKKKMLSHTKMSAVGAADCVPSAASVRPGPI